MTLSRRPRKLASRNLRHPIPNGTSIVVLRTGLCTTPAIEGCAVIRRTALSHNTYWVQFAGDPVLRERVVHPDYQADPERALDVLRDLWRTELGLIADISDFWPDHNL